jgi:predicted RND superfamily exporter protein
MTKELIDELISIVKEKNRLMNEMYETTKTQKEQIKKEDMNSLDSILDKKDHIIKEIDKLDISFMTIFSQIKKEEAIENINELDKDRYPNLRELKEIVKEISSSLMAISLLDEENNKNIKEKLEATKMELRRIKDGKKAYKGYNKTIAGSMLIDEKK